MTEDARTPEDGGDVEAVTRAVLTASRLLVAVSARSLAAVEGRVTLPQFRLLVMLSEQGSAKLVALAARLGVNPSTAMRMVDRLIAAGLVDRRTNPENRRENVLRLTAAGTALVAEVTAFRRREIAEIVTRMAPEQRGALVTALDAFTEAGGEPPAAAPEGRDLYPLGWPDPEGSPPV
ncbi:MarR family winged helix-turn-helix transcriptional regulator [Streptomyces sp. JJ36]|uniref:MarR family winged helix-turn-helix transcriptional regulator n=1 Tax=Streptomyces sp. JJ36 TaxID=2736645 RepID=UPI001F25907D|nr:MarR family transcriptional regulator [Streptomyces sp. JJ36]MCF6522237.1 MarR family transcriptional regulator [Streptomyces sp. JJ36]